jgi:hypothetical protein
MSHERGTPTSTALEEEATHMSICAYCERLVAHSVLRATFPRWSPGVLCGPSCVATGRVGVL